MLKMILMIDEQEKITLTRCLSIFTEQAKKGVIIADRVEIQAAQQLWDTIVDVKTSSIDDVVKQIQQTTKEASNEQGTNNPHEPRATYEKDEPVAA